jgi:hypothetical protein
MRLSDTGQARVAAARERTWYAGPLPVSLGHLERFGQMSVCGCSRDTLHAGLTALDIEPGAIDEIGQAVTGGATLAISGVARDEQASIAGAIGASLQGEAQLPYAIFAAGSVIRVFDPQHHRAGEQQRDDKDGLDILPVVVLAGGVFMADVVPAYDDEAKFYVAPPPFSAWGGVLCVMDSTSNPEALAELARMWLLPGRQQTGIMMLRTGERIELPWRAATVLLNATSDALPAAARDAIAYQVDVSFLPAASLHSFIERRLGAAFPEGFAAGMAAALEQSGLATRVAATAAAQYLRDRAGYEGAAFASSAEVLNDAVEFAGRYAVPQQRPRAA